MRFFMTAVESGALHTELATSEPYRAVERQYDEYIEGLEIATWADSYASFLRDIETADPSCTHLEAYLGLLASMLEKAYKLHLREGEPTKKIAYGVFSALDTSGVLPTVITRQRPNQLNKRSPSFFESVEATLRRYDLMEQLPDVFGELAEGIIVGGSMGYGPFYNVRKAIKGTDSSDIDALVVFDDDAFDSVVKEGFKTHPAVAMDDSQQFDTRLPIFATLRQEDKADIISQRFHIPGDDYTMSIHFFPKSKFDTMTGSELSRDLAQAADKDTVFELRDFKPRRFEHPAATQRGFDGSQFAYPVSKQPPVGEGFLTTLPGYIVHKSRFYTGLYQNLISPNFEALYDRTGFTTVAINGFKKIITDYMTQEVAAGRTADLSLSHTRSGIFAPQRYRGIPN